MTKIIGHRGAAGLAPENTLKAFKIGCEFSDAVECDVHLSNDNELVVIHDETLRRTSGHEGAVGDYNLNQLKEFDFGEGEKIPALSEVVSVVSASKKGLVIEIKGINKDEELKVERRLSDFMNEVRPESDILVCSFWYDAITAFKKAHPKIKTFVIIDDAVTADKAIEIIDSVDADGAGVRSDFITAELVNNLHSRGYFVNAWTVDDEAEFNRLMALGVDMITTNRPDRFMANKLV